MVEILEFTRKRLMANHPSCAADIGLIEYHGNLTGFQMWSEEPRNHVLVTCDLDTVIIDVAAGTETQLREIVAQSDNSAWSYMDISGAVTEGPIDELIAIEMAAQTRDRIERD